MVKRSEKCKSCKGKLYKYTNNSDLDVVICYQCGKFKCKSFIKNEEILRFLIESPLILPYLIKMEYLKPTN